VAGDNELTFTHGPASAAGVGLGWDTIVLEVDEGSAPAPARLAATISRSGPGAWSLTVRNVGNRAVHDLRVIPVADWLTRSVKVNGHDPTAFPVPVAGVLAAGASAVAEVAVSGWLPPRIAVSADGGRTVVTASLR